MAKGSAKPDDDGPQPFQVRLTPEEKEKFETEARARGMKIAPWMRLVAHDECERRAKQRGGG